MPADNGNKKTSFFGSFTLGDWAALVGILAITVGAIWFVVMQQIKIDTGEVRADFTILKADLERMNGNTQQLVVQTEQNLQSSFYTFQEQVGETFQRGMTDRTEELQKSLLAMFQQRDGIRITVANIPRREEGALNLVNAYQAMHGSGTVVVPLGDKVLMQTDLVDLNDSKLIDLSETLDNLEASYPGIETNITWESNSSVMNAISNGTE